MDIYTFYNIYFSTNYRHYIGELYYIYKNLPWKNELSKKYIYIGIPFYVIYLVLEFTSPTYKFLFKKNNKETLYELLGSLFQKRPYIYVSCSCSHEETQSYTKIDSEGNSQTETSTITVNTYCEIQPINYYSYRDISDFLF